MRHLTYILLFFNLICCSITNDNKSIKSIQTDIFSISLKNDSIVIGQKINGGGFDNNSFTTFNKYGGVINYKEYYSNGNLSKEKDNRYSENGYIISSIETDYYGKTSVEKQEYFYNSIDSIIKTVRSSENYNLMQIAYRNQNNLIDTIYEYFNDSLINIQIFKHDKNQTKETLLNSKGDTINDIIQFFDSNNRLIQIILKENTERDSTTTISKFDYYSNDYLQKLTRYVNGEFLNEIEYEYYDNGILKRIVDTPNFSPYSFTTIQDFNIYGDLIQRTQLKRNNPIDTTRLWKYEYEYDENDNWTEKIILVDNKPSTIVIRKIEYYE